MKRGRIPSKLALFAVYIVVVNDYLHTTMAGDTDPRGIVLGMTAAELTALKDFVKKLISGDPTHPGIWDLHSNKDTKTQKTTADLKAAKKEFGVFFRPLLNRMNLSTAITPGDRIALEISDPVTKRTYPKKRIAENIFFNANALTHGELQLECRITSDGSRGSRPATANGVEVAFCIVVAPDGTANEKSAIIIPEPDTVQTRKVFTKARFVLSLGPDYVGKSVYLWVRWVNTKYPNLAGKWSASYPILVS